MLQETRFLSLGQEDPVEKGMASHSSILAWRIPWTEDPGRVLVEPAQHTCMQALYIHIKFNPPHSAGLQILFSL